MSHSSLPPAPGDLTDEERKVVDAIYDQRMTATHYDLLGLRRDADRRAVRDAYFALSKRFHPDVFFKREIGGYRQRFDELFRMFTRAYDVLSNAKQRAGYDLHLANLGNTRVEPAIPEVVAVVRRPDGPAPAPAPGQRTSPTPPRAVPAVVDASQQTPAAKAAPAAPAQPRRTPSVETLPPPAAIMSPSSTNTALREGAVLPPPLRQSTPSPTPSQPPRPSNPSPTMDPAIRQRALESMARRLSAAVPGGSSMSNARGGSSTQGRSPSRQNVAVSADAVAAERSARLAQLLAKADEAQKTGDFETALDALKGALTIKKDDPGIKLKMDAVDQVLRARRVDENIAKARDAMRDGKPLEAATLWEKAWEGRRNDAQLLLNAAEVLARFTSESKRAADLAQRAVTVDPRLVKAHLLLAQIFVKAGLKASAQGALAKVEELDPNNPALKDLREKIGPQTLAQRLNFRIR